MREIPIRDETIRLGQPLKLAGVIASGAEMKRPQRTALPIERNAVTARA